MSKNNFLKRAEEVKKQEAEYLNKYRPDEVSREVTSTTEFLRISSGDNILNCTPIILEGALYSLI